MKKFIVSAIMVFLLGAINSSTSVFAHDVSDYGSETVGWVYTGYHVPTKTSKFFFVIGTEQTWRDRWNAGISDFYSGTSNNLNLVNASAFETDNYVETINLDSATWVARVTSYYSGQHTTHWRAQFNSSKTLNNDQWRDVAEHEIGHIFGLKDLYNSINNHRLMWWTSPINPGLTAAEKTGLKTIWGY